MQTCLHNYENHSSDSKRLLDCTVLVVRINPFKLRSTEGRISCVPKAEKEVANPIKARRVQPVRLAEEALSRKEQRRIFHVLDCGNMSRHDPCTSIG